MEFRIPFFLQLVGLGVKKKQFWSLASVWVLGENWELREKV